MTASKSSSDHPRGETRRLGRVRVAGLVAATLAIALLFAFGGGVPGQRLFDAYQQIAPRQYGNSTAHVVLIDPESLRAVGPWPWPRYVVARLTEAIAQRGAAAIGYDVIFSEEDRYNPDHMASFFPELSPAARAEIAALPSMDMSFADVVGRNPVVLPRVGVDRGSDDFPFAAGRDAATLPVEARFSADLPRDVLSYPRAVTNIPDLDDVAAGQGLINGPPDPDGVVRRVPLIGTVAGVALPGFALELARVGQGLDTIEPVVGGGQLRAVKLGERTIPVAADGRAALRFGRFPDAAVTSALSVLQRGYPADAFKGKIVLVGLAAAATTDIVTTPIAAQYYGVYVQAQAVDAILDGDVLSRPAWAPLLEWGLAAVILLVTILIFPRLGPRSAIVVPILLAIGVIVASVLAFRALGLLIDPIPALAVGGAAGGAVLISLFSESARLQRRLRESLEEERVASAKAAGELDAARDIQRGMLPPRAILHDLHPAIDLDALLEPARTVGGDFFDAMLLEDGRLCFLIGDVTGKGVPAALFMALSRALSKSVLLRQGRDLAAAVIQLNAEISRDNSEDMFVTMLVGVIDPATGHLWLCNAGHENPLRVAVDGAVVELSLDGGPPLCVVADFPYTAEEFTLQQGEALVVVTDGVTEAQSPTGDLFGHAPLLAVLSGAAMAPEWASMATAAIVEAVRSFEAGGEPSDDLTVLVLRYIPAPAP